MLNYPDYPKNKKELISIDIETFDPNLKKLGNGVFRNDGFILGVSVSFQDFSEYYDLNHIDSNEKEVSENKEYLNYVLRSDNPKLGTNLLYDLDWLIHWANYKVNGFFHDIQMAEPLLWEYAKSYSLDTLAKKYLNKQKFKSEIEVFCEENKLKGDPRQHLYKMPKDLVGEYAKQDTALPLQIFPLQKKELQKQSLYELYKMECALIPLLLQMRKNGIPLNKKVSQEYIAILQPQINSIEQKIYKKYGKFNTGSNKQIAEIFDKNGFKYSRKEPTDKMKAKGLTVGNPCFDADALETLTKQGNPIAKDILSMRKKRTVLKNFLIKNVNLVTSDGRLHGNLKPLKADDKGTISGRFSMVDPNLQNQPNPKKGKTEEEKEIAKMCRNCFFPVPGHAFGSFDFCGVEYRVMAHFAMGPGSDKVKQAYIDNPDLDYHAWTSNLTGLERPYVKPLNFGIAYFRGEKATAQDNNWTMAHTKEIFELYKKEMGWIFNTRSKVVSKFKSRGFIFTILNRRARISPFMVQTGKYYSAFNRLIQGTAADIMKKSMLDAYTSGIFDVLIPHLTIHDELCFSIPVTAEGVQACYELKYIMENAVKLDVPLRVSTEYGSRWGNTKEIANIELANLQKIIT